jgi:predicted RNA binding protein YcfA (HicA-like mRNA interferase family)
MNNDQIPFERLRKVLLDLGFAETRIPGPFLYFEHPASGTILAYRNYQPGEHIRWHDFVSTRKQLDENGLVEADDFEALLQKVPV